MRRKSLLPVLFILFSTNAWAAGALRSDPCASPLFFKSLLSNTATKNDFQLSPANHLVRTIVAILHINSHSPDCGTPDSYGNDLTLKMILKSAKGNCYIQQAKISSIPWGDQADARRKDPKEKYSDVSFSITPDPANLSDPKFKVLTLRNSKLSQALVFADNKYYFFSSVGNQDKLALADGDSFNKLFVSIKPNPAH